jgi:predicted transcriptional regulator
MGLAAQPIESRLRDAHSNAMTEPTNPTENNPAPEAEVIKFPKANASKADQRRFEARWGKQVADRGYTMLPAVLIRAQHRLGLSPEEFNALLHLVYHWWEPDHNPFPAKATIAARMDKSPKTVQRYLKALEDGGFIQRIERFEKNKGQTSNEYDLSGLVNKLAAIAAEEAKVAQENAARTTNVERRNNRRGAP